MEGSATAVGGGGTEVLNASLSGIAPPPFLSKTYDMVDDPATDAIVSWGLENNRFVVWNMPEFARDLLPKYFKHNNFSSFIRQLNTYGFRKIDADRWEFASEGFLRGQKHLLKGINRRKPSHTHTQPQQPQAQIASVAACVEVKKSWLEEDIERLKRDKNVVMQELARLRQQQQTTDHQLHALVQQLQGMEQRQQQMMSFLANAMQSPGFLAQLVQRNDSNRRISVGNKKRRLPSQEGEFDGEIAAPSDEQIIDCQPLINEAAKAMLMQILKMDASPRRANSDGLLLKIFPSPPEAMDISSSSSSQNLGVPLTEEAPTSSGIPYISSSPGEIRSSSVADMYESSSVPAAIDISTENFSADTDIDLLYDEGQKLPGIVDPFWEQFLLMPSADSCSVGSEEEVDSSLGEAEEMLPVVNGWDCDQNMDHLMEQMGHLTSSDAKGLYQAI